MLLKGKIAGSALFVILAATSSTWAANANKPPTPGVVDPVPKPPQGFTQVITPAFVVETDISDAYTHKVADMIMRAEQKFYTLFKITPDYMNGVSKQAIDNKTHIPGTALNVYRSFVEVRVYKQEETFANEWFDHTGVTDKMQRLRQGLPGAYTSWGVRLKDSDGKEYGKPMIWIRSFVANRDDDELERTLLHEMGHLFTHAFMLTCLSHSAADNAKGAVDQKKGLPSWIDEGVAQLFQYRWSNAASAQKELLRQQGWVYEAIKLGDSYPFDQFTNITNAHNLKDVAGDPLHALLNYAQSASVMDFMVNTNGAMFFNFLDNLRADNFQKNLAAKDKNHISELFSVQDDCFKKAFSADLAQVEGYWKDHVKKTMDAQLKKSPELYYWIGEYYLRRGKDKENDLVHAEENFNLALSGAPGKGEGYLGMGRMAIRKHDDDNALKLLSKAAELMPKDDDAWYYYGIAQVNAGKLKEAEESFSKAIKIHNLNFNALAGLALAQFHEREYEKSMENYELAYQAAAECAQRNPYFLFQKGHAAFFGKKYREAQMGFAQFCDIYPQDAQAQMWYGLAAWRLGDKEFAMKKLEEAAKLNPNDPNVKEALARAKKGETLTFTLEEQDVADKGDKGDKGDKKGDKNAPEEKKKADIRIEDE